MKVIVDHGYVKDQEDLKEKKKLLGKQNKSKQVKQNDIVINDIDKDKPKKEKVVKQKVKPEGGSPRNLLPVVVALAVTTVAGWSVAGYEYYINTTRPIQRVEASATAGSVQNLAEYAVAEEAVPLTEAEDTVEENLSSEDTVQQDSGIVSEEYLDNATALAESDTIQDYYYTLIPEKYRNLFETSGYTWEVYAGDLSELTGSDSALEYVDTENQVVYINDKDDAAIVHAIGSFLYQNYISDDKDFKALFESDSKKVKDEFSGTYNVSYDTTESFAAAGFYLYVVRPNKLYTTSQDTYMYFKNMEFVSEETEN